MLISDLTMSALTSYFNTASGMLNEQEFLMGDSKQVLVVPQRQ